MSNENDQEREEDKKERCVMCGLIAPESEMKPTSENTYVCKGCIKDGIR